MRISDWSSDVCSSDLKRPAWDEKWRSALESNGAGQRFSQAGLCAGTARLAAGYGSGEGCVASGRGRGLWFSSRATKVKRPLVTRTSSRLRPRVAMTSIRIATDRSEEHTSELQSLMRISYAVFCLKKKKQIKKTNTN